MATGEVSIWIRVKDAFTAGFKAAGNAARNAATNINAAGFALKTAFGHEIVSKIGAIRQAIAALASESSVLGRAGKVVTSVVGKIGAAIVAVATASYTAIRGLSNSYAQHAFDLNRVTEAAFARAQKFKRKFDDLKSPESAASMKDEAIMEISQARTALEEIDLAKSRRKIHERVRDLFGGNREREKLRDAHMATVLEAQGNIRNLDAKEKQLRAEEKIKAIKESAQKEEEDRLKRIGNQLEFNQTITEKAAAAEYDAADPTKKKQLLGSTMSAAESRMLEISGKISDGLLKWSDPINDEMNKLANTYADAGAKLRSIMEDEAKKAEEEAKKAAEVKAEFMGDFDELDWLVKNEIAREKQNASAKAALAALDAREASFKAQAKAGVDAAKKAADAAMFKNRPETFLEKMQGFTARRDEQRDAEKENKAAERRASRLEDKLRNARGNLKLSKEDQKFLNDIQATKRAAAKEAAMLKLAEDRQKAMDKGLVDLGVIRQNIETVLRASGGPN